MRTRTKTGLTALAAVALIAGLGNGGAFLNIALEDVGDARPKRMAVAMKVAGACVGFALSWSETGRQARLGL